MATITLKNVPTELHRRLKVRAAANHRSLNREVIRCLELSLGDADTVGDELINQIRSFRERLAADGTWATAESIAAAINVGR